MSLVKREIWTFEIESSARFKCPMPLGAKVLPGVTVRQNGLPTFSAIVDPESPETHREFMVVPVDALWPDGFELDAAAYIGPFTVAVGHTDKPDGGKALVFGQYHLFEQASSARSSLVI